MGKWNDPDKRKSTIPAVSESIILPPSPRQYGAVRPEPPPGIISTGIANALTRPPETPFEQDLAVGEEAVRGVVRSAATGASNLVGDVSQSVTEGARGLASGVANYFTGRGSGLLSQNTVAPTVTTSVPVGTTSLPAAAQPFVAPPAAGGLVKPVEKGMDLSQFGAGGLQSPVKPPESPYYDRINPTSNGGYTLSPKETAPSLGIAPPARDYNAEVEDLVNTLMKPETAFQGGRKYIPIENLKIIAELRGHQVTAAAGLEGNKIKAEADKAGHGVAAQANLDWRTANLEQRKKEQDLHEKDFQLRLSQQKDIASQNQMNSLLNKHMVYETDPNDPDSKTKIPNWNLTYASMKDSPGAPHPGFKDAIDAMTKREDAYIEEVKRLTATAGKKFDISSAKKEFRKSLSIYYAPPVPPKKGWFQ